MNDKLIEGFVTELKLQQLRSNTIKQYVRAIKRYHSLQKTINNKGVNSFLAEHNHIVNRAAIKKWAEYNKVSIAIRKVKPRPRKLPLAYSEAQVRRLIHEVDTEYQLIVELLAETGCRVGEAVRIKRKHINLEKNSILLPTTKSNPRMMYPRKELLLKLLRNSREVVDNKEGWVFPSKYGSESGHVHENTIRLHLRKVFDGAKPHTFRHTFATRLLEEGVDLVTTRDLLGHQDISTTSIYTRVVQPRAREAASKMWRKQYE